MRRPTLRVPDSMLPWASVVGVLVLFDVLPRIGVLPRDHFPPISDTLGTLGEQLGEASFWAAVGNTLQAGRSGSGSRRRSRSRSGSWSDRAGCSTAPCAG